MNAKRIGWLPLMILLAPTCAWSAGTTPEPNFKTETTAGVEEIYLFRTSRTTRTRGSTPACAQVGFESQAEDYYQLWSITVNSRSARVTDGHVRAVGGFTACFGAITRNQPFKMFATGAVAHLQWSGHGECTAMDAQPPEPAVRAFNCNLAIDGLPAGYAGGWLTSSTLAPVGGATVAADAHVYGYLSSSLVTMRLWKGK